MRDAYSEQQQWLAAYSRALVSGVPLVEDVRDAFVADEIDVEQLDELMAAAVAERHVELPVPVLIRVRRPKHQRRK